jgi:hypothetical protein
MDKSEVDADLIDEIRKFPELYDREETDYKNVVRRRAIWDHIARTIAMPGLFIIYFK